MPDQQLFYRFYDTLFASKDYAGEVEAVLRYARSHLQPLKKVLELGCGTGSHTIELSRDSSLCITAVDVDAEMLALARRKVRQTDRINIAFANECLATEDADLAVALFNVVNYLKGEGSLQGFFGQVAASLRTAGMFIFDCWNGTAALLDPPGSKCYQQQCGTRTVRCFLTSETDAVAKITTLNYHLELLDASGDVLAAEDFRFDHTLWTPEQVTSALRESGFEVKTVCLPFTFDRAASGTDWKIMFVCRKG